MIERPPVTRKIAVQWHDGPTRRALHRLWTRAPQTGMGCLVSALLRALAFCVVAVVKLRGWSYARGWRRTVRLPIPVISVGNLAVGGTGKTPVVRWLSERLAASGWRPAIVSRGYRRRARGTVVLCPGEGRSPDWDDVGDEAALLARLVPEAAMAVGGDRIEAAHLMHDRCGADVVLLDDGFQHWRLERAVDIVLLDARSPFANGRVLPAGPLREPPSALGRADLVVQVDRAGDGGPETPFVRIPSERLGQVRLVPTALLLHPEGTRIPLESLAGKRTFAFCGIAQPEPLGAMLMSLGTDLAGLWAFADHHRYTGRELDAIASQAARLRCEWIVTTGKDLVKCPHVWRPEVPVAALDITVEASVGARAFAAAVESALSPGSGDRARSR